mmetsp:Transcript_31999/g.74997  ORF Transcript_31999/g.74997 Transcript_31999/m.74997 type:complete len:487 (+) Transcript_31999:72-1532(+)
MSPEPQRYPAHDEEGACLQSVALPGFGAGGEGLSGGTQHTSSRHACVRILATSFSALVVMMLVGVAVVSLLHAPSPHRRIQRAPGQNHGDTQIAITGEQHPAEQALLAQHVRETQTELQAEQAALNTATSYQFVYTKEGTAMMEDLLQTGKEQGPLAALTKAQGLLKNQHFLDACHPLLHRLGRAFFNSGGNLGLSEAFRTLLPFDEAAATEAKVLLTERSAALNGSRSDTPAAAGTEQVKLLMVCNAAYLHGVSERFLYQAGLAGNLEAAVQFVEQQVCARFTNQAPHCKWECHHGLGHGIIQYKRYEATRAALQAALEASGKAIPRFRQELWNGIWMDHFASTTVSGHDVDDPSAVLSICVDEEVANHRGTGDCFMYSPTSFLLHRPQAYEAAHDWCRDGCMGLPNHADECLGGCTFGVGMQTMKESMDSMHLVNTVCLKASSPTLKHRCISGATSYYSFATGSRPPSSYCSQLDASLISGCQR